MAKKKTTTKKPKLKIDKVELVEKLECLRKKGQEMLQKDIVNEAEYDDWYSHVLILLRNSFDIPENKFKMRFELPLAYILESPTSVSSVQNQQARIKEYFNNSIVNIEVIIDDISTSY